MVIPVIMPQVGQDLKTARILEWHVEVGDKVKKGDVLAMVESDKASFEVEAFEAGTILQLLFKEGEEAEVFKPIAYMGRSDEPVNHLGQETLKQSPSNFAVHKPAYSGLETLLIQKTKPLSDQVSPGQAGKKFASPSAKRLAKENKLNISKLTGSGPSGRIIKKDIIASLETRNANFKISPLAEEIARQESISVSSVNGTGVNGKILKSDIFEYIIRNKKISIRDDMKLSPKNESDQVIMFSKMRKIIAEKLTWSKESKPHFYLFADMDVTNVLTWKEQYEADNNIKISINDIIIHTVGKLLLKFPHLNAHVDSEKLILKKEINIGMAVALEHGLIVPVIPFADRKNIEQIALLARSLAINAKKGIIDIKHEGTFTISNLGMFGITGFQAIINPPESAILTVGGIEKRIIPDGTGIMVRDYMTTGLACDHRAVDGSYGAAFLKELKNKFFNYPDI